ncbi:hypothetical protein Tco_1469330, partial [Tanacetum coccineum]
LLYLSDAIARLESSAHISDILDMQVVVAAETGGALGGMVRQLSIYQFENEGRRVSYGTLKNATAAISRVSIPADAAETCIGSAATITKSDIAAGFTADEADGSFVCLLKGTINQNVNNKLAQKTVKISEMY